MLKFRSQVVRRVNLSLENYIRPITAVRSEWITFLSLNDIACSRSDLINLEQLTNLGVLTVGPGVRTADASLEDSIIRAWARAAVDHDAFSMLRVFACRRQMDITVRVIEYLSHLSALSLFVLEDCHVSSGVKAKAESFDWKYHKSKAVKRLLDNSGCASGSWEDVTKSLHSHSLGLDMASLKLPHISTKSAVAILNMSMSNVPKNATTGGSSNDSLRCFERVKRPKLESRLKAEHCSASELPGGARQGKRMLDHIRTADPCKRRTIKASRQKEVESTFQGFGI